MYVDRVLTEESTDMCACRGYDGNDVVKEQGYNKRTNVRTSKI